jgi:putative oxidoreductase
MTGLLSSYDRAARGADRLAGWLLPTAARLVFAGVLLGYFWTSALTKLEGPFTPSLGAYAQIFPRAFEAAGYDVAQMGLWQTLVVLAGAWAEFALPALIVVGLFTRLAALGMVGFVVVQSLTDILGHGAGAETVGAWFDPVADALILDQRAFWMLLLLVLILKGAGPISADRFLARARPPVAA